MDTNEKDKKLIERIKRGMRYNMTDEEIGMPDVNAEYAKFMARHKRQVKMYSLLGLRKMAAALITLMILSGIAYAAVEMFQSGEKKTAGSEPAVTVVKADTAAIEHHDTTVQNRPVVYDNVTLNHIVADLCRRYHVKAQFENEDAKRVRLYLQTETGATLDETILLLNHFEKVNIEHEGDKLIIR